MTNIDQLQMELLKYVDLVEKFLIKSELNDLVNHTFDHVAVKLKDSNDYETFLMEILPVSSSVNYIVMNNRRVAMARLNNSLKLRGFGKCEFMEIMEPKPEKAGKSYVGMEHAEIVVENLGLIEAHLKERHIIYEKKDNGFHICVIVKFETDQELKFSNLSISEIVELEKKERRIRILK